MSMKRVRRGAGPWAAIFVAALACGGTRAGEEPAEPAQACSRLGEEQLLRQLPRRRSGDLLHHLLAGSLPLLVFEAALQQHADELIGDEIKPAPPRAYETVPEQS